MLLISSSQIVDNSAELVGGIHGNAVSLDMVDSTVDSAIGAGVVIKFGKDHRGPVSSVSSGGPRTAESNDY